MKGVNPNRFKRVSQVALLWAMTLPLWIALAWGQPLGVAMKEGDRQLRFNQNQGSIFFEASSTLHSVKGKVTKFEGRILLPSMEDRSSGSVILDIPASGLDTDHEGRDKRIKETCLEVSRFPSIRFESTEIRNRDKDYSPGLSGKAEVTGLLDLHGVQKRIVVPVDYTYAADHLQVKGKVTIKMSDFRIPEPKFLFLRVKDEIKIEFEIHAFPPSNLPERS
jgi:polyisoprenoid-binding protein YceI